MRTSALRVTVGAYSDGHWHVSITSDEYERGVQKDSHILAITHYTTAHQVRWAVREAVDKVIMWEEQRVESEGAAGQPSGGASAAS